MDLQSLDYEIQAAVVLMGFQTRSLHLAEPGVRLINRSFDSMDRQKLCDSNLKVSELRDIGIGGF